MTEEAAARAIPHPGLIHPSAENGKGANPANDFALALQKANDLKDLFDDFSNGIRRWPSAVIEAHKLTYETLVNSIDEEERKKAYRVLNYLVSDTIPVFDQALKFVELIPQQSVGLRRFCGTSLLTAAATIRSIDRPEFFTKKDLNVSRREIFEIDDIVRYLTHHKQSLAPYLNHILNGRQLSDTYRAK